MRNTPVACVFATALLAATATAQSLSFTTGVDGAVEYPFDAAMSPPTGITVEAWITFDDTTVPTGLYYWPTIARQNIAPGAETWNLRVSSGTTGNRNLDWIVRTPTGLSVVTYFFATGEFAQFTHIAATYDGTVMNLYKNGVQVATRTLTSSNEVQNTGGILRVGNGDASTPGRETWNGKIDELRVWPMARTAAEITATMGEELMSMPGHVLTFNFNNGYVESSRGLAGTAVGTTAFAPGPNLLMVMPVALQLGQSSTTCARTIETAIGSAPEIGNTAFAVWCTRGPRPANSPFGVVIAATSGATPGQPPFFGVNLAVNPGTVIAEAFLIPGTSGLGTVRTALPIPNNPSYSGVGFIFQYGFADATCGPQGFSSSDGLAFTIY